MKTVPILEAPAPSKFFKGVKESKMPIVVDKTINQKNSESRLKRESRGACSPINGGDPVRRQMAGSRDTESDATDHHQVSRRWHAGGS